jgi:hypothetical protein
MLHDVHGLIHLIIWVHVIIVHISSLCRRTLGLVHFVFSFLAFLPLLSQVDEFPLLSSASFALTAQRGPLIFQWVLKGPLLVSRVLKGGRIELLQIEIERRLWSKARPIPSIPTVVRIEAQLIL